MLLYLFRLVTLAFGAVIRRPSGCFDCFDISPALRALTIFFPVRQQVILRHLCGIGFGIYCCFEYLLHYLVELFLPGIIQVPGFVLRVDFCLE